MKNIVVATAFAVVAGLLSVSSPAEALQCVPYARDVSGINLSGNAWQWWAAAAGRYERGNDAREGSILVFKRQGKMRYGHVAVISRLLSNRVALIDHANWAPARSAGRGKITRAMPIMDVSPKNDWTSVRVWYAPVNDYGDTVYRTEGFIHQDTSTHATKISRPQIQSVALSRAASLYAGGNDRADLSVNVSVRPNIRPATPVTIPSPDAPVTAHHDRNLMNDGHKRPAPAPTPAPAPAPKPDKVSAGPSVEEIAPLALAKADMITAARGLFASEKGQPGTAEVPLVLN